MTDLETLLEEKRKVSEAMIERGGGFVKALGMALRRADLNNINKIRDTWPDMWEKYLDWYPYLDSEG